MSVSARHNQFQLLRLEVDEGSYANYFAIVVGLLKYLREPRVYSRSIIFDLWSISLLFTLETLWWYSAKKIIMFFFFNDKTTSPKKLSYIFSNYEWTIFFTTTFFFYNYKFNETIFWTKFILQILAIIINYKYLKDKNRNTFSSRHF